MSMKSTVVGFVVLVAIAFPALAASGWNWSGYFTNPVGLCDGALPSYEGSLRKRPTALANEGAVTAFLSCSMQQPVESTTPEGSGPVRVSFFLGNPSRTSNAMVSCTLVAGTIGADAPTPIFYTKSAQFEAGSASHRSIDFVAAQYGITNFRAPVNLSCGLAPGIELNDIFVTEFQSF